MFSSTRWLMGSIVALLAAVTVGAVLLVGTALAQGGQQNTPGNGWGRGMMGGHRGYSMHAAAPIADTTTYGGWNRGMMGPMLYGTQGTYVVTDTTTYGGTHNATLAAENVPDTICLTQYNKAEDTAAL